MSPSDHTPNPHKKATPPAKVASGVVVNLYEGEINPS